MIPIKISLFEKIWRENPQMQHLQILEDMNFKLWGYDSCNKIG